MFQTSMYLNHQLLSGSWLGSHAESGNSYAIAVAPNAVAPCSQNIVAMLLCERTFQKRCVNTGA